ncbi:MAG: hypothetical protein ACRCZH_03310 [Cetobacterium sp.]
MKFARFSEAEKEIILSEKYSTAELEVMLNRSKTAITNARYHLKKGNYKNSRHAWSPSDIEMLKNEKIKVSEIAEKLGISLGAVYKKLSLMKISVARKNGKTFDEEARIIFMRASGKTIKEISNITGTDYNSIKYICRKNGMISN